MTIRKELEELRHATANLTYPSHQPSPIEPFAWPAKTNAYDEIRSRAAGRMIEEDDFDDFWYHLEDEPDATA